MSTSTPDIVEKLSFRTAAVGGAVDTQLNPQMLDAVVAALRGGTARSLLALIHGYNNTYDDAGLAYDSFRSLQRRLAQLPANRPIADNSVFLDVYWPGDADWGLVSFLFYMGSIKQALSSADMLQRALAYIARRVTPLQLDIVAHSMGCRLTFETMKRLGNTPGVRINRVVLMAGAVPTFMLESTSEPHGLRKGYEEMLGGSSGRAKSLYSTSDMVLALAFPVGQTLAPGDEGVFPTALGHEKWSNANAPANLDQYEVRSAGHSDYWGWKQGDEAQGIAADANRQVQSFLGFHHAPASSLPARQTPGAAPTVARSTAPARGIGRDATTALASYWSQ